MKIKCINILALLALILFIAGCVQPKPNNGGRTEDYNVNSVVGQKPLNSVESDNHDETPLYQSRSKTKPSTNMIALDLIGHTISDVDPKGYHDSNWAWRIDDGEIKELQIIETAVDETDLYVPVINVRLHAKGNYSYDTKLKLIYRYSSNQGWILETVSPLSLQLITDGLYDDFISVEKISDLYGTHWYINNNCDSPLTVFYRTFLRGNCEKHHVTVRGNENVKASVWSLDDCIIDYVIKDY